MGFRVTELAIQVHGGYGYCREYPVEQFMRDCKDRINLRGHQRNSGSGSGRPETGLQAGLTIQKHRDGNRRLSQKRQEELSPQGHSRAF